MPILMMRAVIAALEIIVAQIIIQALLTKGRISHVYELSALYRQISMQYHQRRALLETKSIWRRRQSSTSRQLKVKRL